MPKPLLVLAITAFAVFAQQPDKLHFEVASVKRSAAGTQSERRGGPGTNEPEKITITNFPLRPVITSAYGMKMIGPDWLDQDRFDIIARVPSGATKEDAMAMMRNLLIERFGLTTHVEPNPAPFFEMVVAKPSAGLKEWKENPADPALRTLTSIEMGGLHRDENGIAHMPNGRSGLAFGFNPNTGSGHLEAVQVTMETFATFVGGRVNQQVRDKTSLPGKYTFTIDFKPTGLSLEGDNASEPTADIVTVLRSQLGLKLDRKEVPVDVLIVDKIQRTPEGN